MSLPIWQRTITDLDGNVVPNATIEVRLESTGALATVFLDRDGDSPGDNPFTANAEGFAQFYAAPGEYRITATGPSGSQTWRWNVLPGTAATMENESGGSTLGTAATMTNSTGDDTLRSAAALSQGTGATDLLNATDGYWKGNILGTVSQDDGTPTGAIIERGSFTVPEPIYYEKDAAGGVKIYGRVKIEYDNADRMRRDIVIPTIARPTIDGSVSLVAFATIFTSSGSTDFDLPSGAGPSDVPYTVSVNSAVPTTVRRIGLQITAPHDVAFEPGNFLRVLFQYTGRWY